MNIVMYDGDEDQYSRTCKTCDHVHSFEKNVNQYVQKKSQKFEKSVNINVYDVDQYSSTFRTCDHVQCS